MGRGARDLDPAHRRDGLGLALVAGAATLVAATWFGVDGWFVSWADMVMTSLIGALAWVSPLILLGLAWRFLRHPDDNATTGRLVIGAGAVLVGVIGLWHLVMDSATPSDGAEAMAAGGGVIGWIATAPIVAAVGPIVAGLVLALLLAFGVMVLTATSIASVRAGSRRVARGAVGLVRRDAPRAPCGRCRSMRTTPDDDEDVPDLHEHGSFEDAVDDYQHTTMLEDEDRPAAILMAGVTGSRHVPPPARRAAEPLLTEPVPIGPPRTQRDRRDLQGRARPPGRAADDPAPRLLQAAQARGAQDRARAQDGHEGERPRRRRADRGHGAVRHRRPDHRLHARPDGHALRDRARPERQGRARHRAVEEHRLRGGERRRPHPQPDPGQEGDRRRDPEHRPRARGARRRAAEQLGHQRPPPAGGGARQGRRGRLRHGQPRADAAPARRRAPPAPASRAASTA